MPDMVNKAGFGVDHYRPKSLFAHLVSEYSNLFYCCNTCNRYKGNFWPTSHQEKAGALIPNPCSHEMFAHLQFIGARVQAKSTTGSFAVDALKLNSDSVIEHRKQMKLVARSLGAKRAEAEKLLRDVDTRLATASGAEKKKLEKLRKTHIEELDRMRGLLASF